MLCFYTLCSAALEMCVWAVRGSSGRDSWWQEDAKASVSRADGIWQLCLWLDALIEDQQVLQASRGASCVQESEDGNKAVIRNWTNKDKCSRIGS